MTQSPLLQFESSEFAIVPGEDERTNPGIYGQSLANWLAHEISAKGFSPDNLVPEDFGWCIPVDFDSYRLFVTCASTSERATEWVVFVFAEGGILARLLGRDRRAESVRSLFAAVKTILKESPMVSGLREEAT